MSNEKSSGYNNTPITAKIKKTTQGGMKVEQPLIGSYAPVQMNSPAKNILHLNQKDLHLCQTF